LFIPIVASGQIPSTADPQQTGKRSSCCTKTRIIRCAAITGGGVLVFALDGKINTFDHKPRLHGKTADNFFATVEDLGRETPYLIGIPLLLTHGLIFKNEKTFKTGGELAAGLVGIQLITLGVKETFGRKRPYESDSPRRFFKGGTSFYSGHTVTVFTAATIIASNYPKQNMGFMGIHHDIPLVPVLAYSAAASVGMQRLYNGVHWGSDVYVGAVVGYAAGRLAVRFGDKVKIGYFGQSPGIRAVVNF